MAKKGDRGSLEPLAKRLWAEGYSLSFISVKLKVSVTSLSLWKKSTTDPKTGIDEWDKARLQKQDGLPRVWVQFNKVLSRIEDNDSGSNLNANIDALTKITSLIKTLEAIEAAKIAAMQQEDAPDIDRPALFLEFFEWLVLKLKEMDPEGLKTIAKNYDSLLIQFKIEHAQTA